MSSSWLFAAGEVTVTAGAGSGRTPAGENAVRKERRTVPEGGRLRPVQARAVPLSRPTAHAQLLGSGYPASAR